MRIPAIDIPRERLAAFCRRHAIRRLTIFGSVLREDFGAQSDVDVLVEFEPGARLGLRFFTVERELSELIGRKVDLNTPGFLGDEVLAEARARGVVQYVAQ